MYLENTEKKKSITENATIVMWYWYIMTVLRKRFHCFQKKTTAAYSGG